MDKCKIFLVALVVIPLFGCGTIANHRANSFIEAAPTSTRDELVEKREPVKTIENAIGFTIDCFDVLVVCSDPNGRVVKTVEVPRISQRELFSMLTGSLLDFEIYFTAFNLSLDQGMSEEDFRWFTEVLASCRDGALLVADYAHDAALLSEEMVASARVSGMTSAYALTPPPQQTINIYPSNNDSNVIYTSPSRSAQIGSGLGYGMGIGIAQGAAQAQVKRAMQERNEFLALERRARQAAERYKRFLEETRIE